MGIGTHKGSCVCNETNTVSSRISSVNPGLDMNWRGNLDQSS